MEPNQEVRPWERQEGESSKAFFAFCLYRDLGLERSITKVAQKYNAERNLRGLMGRWSKKWSWVKRVREYENHIDRVARAEHEADLKKMTDRHLTLSMAMQAKGAEKLKGLDGKTLSPRAAITAITAGAKLERLSRGEVTEQVGGKISAQITTPGPLPWEEMPTTREAIERIKKKLREEKDGQQPGT